MQPSPVQVRRALHHVHAISAILLMATGVLLTLPDLRARLIGGYGREILSIHLWAGWVFLAAPPLALAGAPRRLLADLRERLMTPPGLAWRRLHTASVLVAGLLLAVTGIVLWLDLEMPRTLFDLMADVHEVLSWFVIAELGIHLVAARRKIVEQTRALFSRRAETSAEEALFDFVDED